MCPGNKGGPLSVCPGNKGGFLSVCPGNKGGPLSVCPGNKGGTLVEYKLFHLEATEYENARTHNNAALIHTYIHTYTYTYIHTHIYIHTFFLLVTARIIPAMETNMSPNMKDQILQTLDQLNHSANSAGHNAHIVTYTQLLSQQWRVLNKR